MVERKMLCPKCSGHIAFPKEMAGGAAVCPHCQQAIILGSKPRSLLWAMISIAIACLLSAIGVIWHFQNLRSKDTGISKNSQSVKIFNNNDTQLTKIELTDDDRAIEKLCRSYYDRINQKDFQSVRQMLSTPCQLAFTVDDVRNDIEKSVIYRFLSVDSITYCTGPSVKWKGAKVRVRRIAQERFGEAEGVRELKCVKESNGWRMFWDLHWSDKIISEFESHGFSQTLRSNITLFCSNDLFNDWPENVTNAFEKIYAAKNQGEKEVFPWNLSFVLQSNYVDGSMLNVSFTLKNNAECLWKDPHLELLLKQNGKAVLHRHNFLPKLQSGMEASGEFDFVLNEKSQENAHYDLDVFYTLGRSTYPIATNLSVEVKIVKLTDVVKFELVRKSFDITRNTSDENMLVARLDYRVKNVGNQSLKSVQLQFVWSSLKGEVLNQTKQYVVGYGDLPLAPQQTKYGFVHCGVGYVDRREPVRADIYLEDGERRWPVAKAVLIQ